MTTGHYTHPEWELADKSFLYEQDKDGIGHNIRITLCGIRINEWNSLTHRNKACMWHPDADCGGPNSVVINCDACILLDFSKEYTCIKESKEYRDWANQVFDDYNNWKIDNGI